MNSPKRPTLFYLFPEGNDFKIRPMTDVEAVALRDKGKLWVDVPQKTLADAEELRALYIAQKKSTR
jgi:hypothetical protein